jgi:hypothetical protein
MSRRPGVDGGEADASLDREHAECTDDQDSGRKAQVPRLRPAILPRDYWAIACVAARQRERRGASKGRRFPLSVRLPLLQMN